MDFTDKKNLMEENAQVSDVDIDLAVAVRGADSDEITPTVEKETKRILIVDDTENIVKLVKMYLEHHHYEVITAYNGQEGLDKAKAESPDLIILDLMLPRINGYKVCGLLKRDIKYAKIPIILFSAKTQEKDMKLGRDVGADAYLTKPFEPDVLLSKINEFLVR